MFVTLGMHSNPWYIEPMGPYETLEEAKLDVELEVSEVYPDIERGADGKFIWEKNNGSHTLVCDEWGEVQGFVIFDLSEKQTFTKIDPHMKHPSHVTKIFDSSLYDEKCINCGATGDVPSGWGVLAYPCVSTLIGESEND